jgi:hypothetical protein
MTPKQREANRRYEERQKHLRKIIRELDPVRGQLARDPVPASRQAWAAYRDWLVDYRERLRSLQRICEYDPGPQHPRW